MLNRKTPQKPKKGDKRRYNFFNSHRRKIRRISSFVKKHTPAQQKENQSHISPHQFLQLIFQFKIRIAATRNRIWVWTRMQQTIIGAGGTQTSSKNQTEKKKNEHQVTRNPPTKTTECNTLTKNPGNTRQWISKDMQKAACTSLHKHSQGQNGEGGGREKGATRGGRRRRRDGPVEHRWRRNPWIGRRKEGRRRRWRIDWRRSNGRNPNTFIIRRTQPKSLSLSLYIFHPCLSFSL